MEKGQERTASKEEERGLFNGGNGIMGVVCVCGVGGGQQLLLGGSDSCVYFLCGFLRTEN